MGWWWVLMLLAMVLMGVGVFLLMRKDWSPVFMESIERSHERLDRTIRDEISRIKSEGAEIPRQTQDVARELKEMQEALEKKISEQILEQRNNIDSLSSRVGQMTQDSEGRLEQMKKIIEERLQQIQDNSAKNMEAVRLTVDEKLQGTLERQLGESFRQVSERLEQVHQGLGDMRNLATGVGDLKKIFSNVELRGTWGEVQLENLLSEILSPGQYEKNVRTGEQNNEVVEFAIRLPGGGGVGEEVWLPIDAKFPLEDYLRMTEAQEKGEGDKAQEASKALETRLKGAAKDVTTKYLHPPQTTDFGILYLPAEGLYAEIVRRPDLISFLQREYRVLVAGPSTFAALLNSLQIGFRTLAIQKRSSEVWQILSIVKTEFGRFGGILEGVKKRLDQASSTMDDALKRSRIIQQKLHNVQEDGMSGMTLLQEEEELPSVAPVAGQEATTEEVKEEISPVAPATGQEPATQEEAKEEIPPVAPATGQEPATTEEAKEEIPPVAPATNQEAPTEEVKKEITPVPPAANQGPAPSEGAKKEIPPVPPAANQGPAPQGRIKKAVRIT